MTKLNVSAQHSGKRLDLYLALELPKFSRSALKKQIVSEKVFVNGQIQFYPQYKVKEGERVELELPQKLDNHRIVPAQIDFDVLADTSHYLVINKSAGVVVHPGSAHFKDTLANGIKYYLQQKGEDIFDAERAGLIHRLDKGTSGVIVVAKTPEALWKISSQFAQRQVAKEYLALVQGETPISFEVRNKLGRDKYNRQKFSSRTKKGKSAYTQFESIAAVPGYSLIKAKPYTGRTHQIRVHLKEQGFPIVGDKKYGGETAHRLMLHAYQLCFYDLAGEWKSYTAPMGADFKQELERRGFDGKKKI